MQIYFFNTLMLYRQLLSAVIFAKYPDRSQGEVWCECLSSNAPGRCQNLSGAQEDPLCSRQAIRKADGAGCETLHPPGAQCAPQKGECVKTKSLPEEPHRLLLHSQRPVEANPLRLSEIIKTTPAKTLGLFSASR